MKLSIFDGSFFPYMWNDTILGIQRALRPNATHLFIGISVEIFFQVIIRGAWIRRTTTKNIHGLAVLQSRKDLITITKLCETGKRKPIINKQFAFDEIPELL